MMKTPIGATHKLIDSAMDGPFFEFIKVEGECAWSWGAVGWWRDCNVMQHMNLYTKIADEAVDEDAEELAYRHVERMMELRNA